MNTFLHDLPDDDPFLPDPNCFFCGGTGLAPNGWDDCPECMFGQDEDDYQDGHDDDDDTYLAAYYDN